MDREPDAGRSKTLDIRRRDAAACYPPFSGAALSSLIRPDTWSPDPMRIFVNEFCGHPFQMELSRKLAKMGHQVYHVYFADNDSTPKGETQRRPDDAPGLTIEGLHIQRE